MSSLVGRSLAYTKDVREFQVVLRGKTMRAGGLHDQLLRAGLRVARHPVIQGDEAEVGRDWLKTTGSQQTGRVNKQSSRFGGTDEEEQHNRANFTGREGRCDVCDATHIG